MMRLFAVAVLCVLLTLVSARLVLKIADDLASPVTLPAVAAAPVVTSEKSRHTDVPAQEKPPLTNFPQTTSRPLFFSGRQFPKAKPREELPPPEATEPPPEEPVAAPTAVGLKLRGVRIDADGRKALISEVDSEPRWYSVGDSAGGWNVTDISVGRAILQSGSTSVTLELYASPPAD